MSLQAASRQTGEQSSFCYRQSITSSPAHEQLDGLAAVGATGTERHLTSVMTGPGSWPTVSNCTNGQMVTHPEGTPRTHAERKQEAWTAWRGARM